jgi:hypothetical protein
MDNKKVDDEKRGIEEFSRKSINSASYEAEGLFDFVSKEPRSGYELETITTKVQDSVTFSLGEDRYEIVATKKGHLEVIRTGPSDEILEQEKEKQAETKKQMEIARGEEVLGYPSSTYPPKGFEFSQTPGPPPKVTYVSGKSGSLEPITPGPVLSDLVIAQRGAQAESDKIWNRERLPIKEYVNTDLAVKYLSSPRTTSSKEFLKELETLRKPLKEITIKVPRGVTLSYREQRQLQKRIKEIIKGTPPIGIPIESRSKNNKTTRSTTRP